MAATFSTTTAHSTQLPFFQVTIEQVINIYESKSEIIEQKTEAIFIESSVVKDVLPASPLLNYRINWLDKILEEKKIPREVTKIVNEYWDEDFTHSVIPKTKMTTFEKISTAILTLFCCKGHLYCKDSILNRHLETENLEGIAQTYKFEGPLRSKIDCEFLLNLARQNKVDSLCSIAKHAKIDKTGSWFSSSKCLPDFYSKLPYFELDWVNDNSCSSGIAFINSLCKALLESKKVQYPLLIAYLKYHLIKPQFYKYIFDKPYEETSCCSRSASVNLYWYLLDKYILQAVENNDVDIIFLFLKFGIDVNDFCCNHWISLPKISGKENHNVSTRYYYPHAFFHPKISVKTVSFWLKQGVSPDFVFNFLDTYKITLLIFAIWRNNKVLIEFLLANNADPYFPCVIDREIITPINFAKNIDDFYIYSYPPPSLSEFIQIKMKEKNECK